MKKLTKNQVLRLLRHLFIVVIGNAIAAGAAGFFIKPNNLAMGGTTGIGLFFRVIFPDNTYIAEAVVYIANISLYIIGVIVLGKKFALSTALGTVLYPTFYTIYSSIMQGRTLTDNNLLAVICASVLMGTGIGLVVKEGSSTGGTDIPPLIINKFTGFPVSVSLRIIDFGVLILQLFVVSFETVLYGAIFIILFTFILDKVSVIGMKKIQFKVISESYEEIHKMIVEKLTLGVTVLYGQTGYLREKCHMLVTVVSRRNSVRLRNEILKIDPGAFITISEVSDVRGRGFSTDRVYLSRADIERRREMMSSIIPAQDPAEEILYEVDPQTDNPTFTAEDHPTGK